ncbi:MAG: hypothetical protein O8C63_09345 [Candidatus Methanoperedens sp.]|nr:hypothetical protein [Candidatus Methanoperedens sp.]
MARKIRKQKQLRCGVLVSYDPLNDGYDLENGWLDTLLDQGEVSFSTWNITDAWEGLPVFIYKKNVGIVACAQIVQPMSQDEYGIMGAIDKEKYPFEIIPPISLKKLRDADIISKNPPVMFQYLTEEQCIALEDWLE